MKKLIVCAASFITAAAMMFSGCSKTETENNASSQTVSQEEEKSVLRVHHFNAGKADSCIITDGSKYVMIDTGEDELAPELLAYFKENSIEKLDYLIITHFDKDHVGSAADVIGSVEVDNVLQSNVPKDSEYYDNYLTALEEKSIDPVTVSGDMSFELDYMSFTVNGPETVYEKNESNNSSLITSLIYGNSKLIFMGDAQNDRIKDFVAINKTDYDFVKMPYHGNYQKQLDELLNSITPEYAVITSSTKYPEEEKMTTLLDDMGIQYYLTRKGDVDITSDGESITVDQ